MDENKSCGHVWNTENANKLPCHHPYYASLDGKNYCVFHHPDVKTKEMDLLEALHLLFKNSHGKDKKIDLRESIFGKIVFSGEIKNDVDFSHSQFWEDVNFHKCQFLGLTEFKHSRFLGWAIFEGSKFPRQVNFNDCQFSQNADFKSCQFSETVFFKNCQFSGYANFNYVVFSRFVHFQDGQFLGLVHLRSCQFSSYSFFTNIHFSEDTNFQNSKFSENVTFLGVEFAKFANFEDCQFFAPVNFMRTSFQEMGYFKNAKFAKEQGCKLEFKNSDYTEADFRPLDLSGVDLANACLTGIKYNKKGKFKGINATSCWGNMQFRRFAMDQAYIEELYDNRRSAIDDLKKEKRKPLKMVKWAWQTLWIGFWLQFWKWSSNLARNIWLWIFWSIGFAVVFAGIFTVLGEEAFDINAVNCQSILLEVGPSPPRSSSSDVLFQKQTGCQGLGFSFWTMLYYSIVTFTTLGFGDVTPLTGIAAIFVVLEVIVGYVMLGGLISILANKLARRAD